MKVQNITNIDKFFKVIDECAGKVERTYILKLLHAQVNINGHIIGAAVGSGMTGKCAVMGGADFLLALSAGKYRIMGRSKVK